ncbi:MAG: hypothetical protein HXY24_19270, partial [Rubrivivax sp.]|nr:hypothetical protein [Rubrivivax sp.]
MSLRSLLTALGLLAVAAAADQGPPPAEPPADAPPVAESATLTSYQVEKLEQDQVVRITLRLSAARDTAEGGFGDSQATFTVVVPNTRRAPRLPERIDVAEPPVAELVLRTPPGSPDLQVLVRLSTPSACKAYAKPADKTVVIECRIPPAEPRDRPPRRGPSDGQFGDRQLDLEFVDTDLRVILSTLMEQSGANLVLQPGIEGNYSLTLHQVTLTEALDAIWEAWDLAWKPLPGNIILVGKLEVLGDDEVEAKLAVPPGWSPAGLWQAVSDAVPGLRLARPLESVPEGGPLTVAGKLRLMNPARRWVAELEPLPQGAAPSVPLRAPERVEYYPRGGDLAALAELVRQRFAELEVQIDEPLGRLVLSGNRETVERARAALLDADHAPDPETDKAFWVPVVPLERIQALAAAAGLTCEIVHETDGATLVYVRGPASKVKVIEELVAQIQGWQQQQPAPAPPRTSQRLDLQTLGGEQAVAIAAGAGTTGTAQADGRSVLLEGDPVAVAQMAARVLEADEPERQGLWKVRYARAEDLLRLVRAAVPELRLAEIQSQRRPGDTEPERAARAGVVPREQGQLGPTLEDWTVGPGCQLLVLGRETLVDRALRLLEAVDVAPAEVELTAMLLELSDAAARRFGLDWRIGAEAVEFPFEPLVGGDLSAVRRLLEDADGVSLLAGPTVRTIDGGAARLELGEVDPDHPAAGQFGATLELRPSVPGDGSVVCWLQPKVRAWVPDGDGRCRLRTHNLETVLRLADGGVAAVGGLLPE